jgi:regulator of protease activity HflC (stomatin/prohibitin superfamily)
LKQYDIECVDTLIGDIAPPPELMKILADRKVAEQQQEMYKMQKQSEEKRQEFVKAQTAATKEADLTGARYDKDIATQVAEAKVETAKGDRESNKIIADGDAYVLTTVGAAKADNISKVGTAEAEVIKKKTDAMGQEKYAIVQVAEHLAKNNVEIVPRILIQGSGKNSGGIVDALISNEMLKSTLFDKTEKEEKEEVKKAEEKKDTSDSEKK